MGHSPFHLRRLLGRDPWSWSLIKTNEGAEPANRRSGGFGWPPVPADCETPSVPRVNEPLQAVRPPARHRCRKMHPVPKAICHRNEDSTHRTSFISEFNAHQSRGRPGTYPVRHPWVRLATSAGWPSNYAPALRPLRRQASDRDIPTSGGLRGNPVRFNKDHGKSKARQHAGDKSEPPVRRRLGPRHLLVLLRRTIIGPALFFGLGPAGVTVSAVLE